MITKDDLVKRALVKLAVIDPRETLSADDQQTGVQAYDSLYAELSEQGHVAWPNTGDHVAEIPARYQTPMTHILAAELALDYGKPEMTAINDQARRRLYRLTTNKYEPHPIPTEFM